MLPIGGAPARPRRGVSWWWLLRLPLAAVPAVLLVGVATGVGDRLGRGTMTDTDWATAAIATPLCVGALLVALFARVEVHRVPRLAPSGPLVDWPGWGLVRWLALGFLVVLVLGVYQWFGWSPTRLDWSPWFTVLCVVFFAVAGILLLSPKPGPAPTPHGSPRLPR